HCNRGWFVMADDDVWLNDVWDELFSWCEEPTKRSAASGVEPMSAPPGREVRQAAPAEPDLGTLADLPGVWRNLRQDPDASPFAGRGWNLIALPFASQAAIPPYLAG